jgi:hypothetical protein
MDIQTELQKIHHQFGVSEKANYEIQKLFEMSIKSKLSEIEIENRIKGLNVNTSSGSFNTTYNNLYKIMNCYADDVMGGCTLSVIEWFKKFIIKKTNKMETIFKKGDTVYFSEINKACIKKGIIYEIIEESQYPIKVDFEDKRRSFTLDGKLIRDDRIETLSFTPYTIELKGFSQERPTLKIEKGTLVYVRNILNHTVGDQTYVGTTNWAMRYFSHFENGKIFCFEKQNKSDVKDKTVIWDEFSLVNPLEDENYKN